MISNLPSDLVEEIISRVPVKFMGAVRSTCRKWNSLSKDTSFTNKHIGKAAAESAKEREFVMLKEDFSVYLISVNLNGTQNDKVDLSINPKGRLVSLDSSDPIPYMCQVSHCNGLLLCLCISSNITARLVVWNPYWEKKRWVEPTNNHHQSLSDMFAFGYDKSCGSHKILRIFNTNNLEIYDLSSDSWRVLNATVGRNIKKHGVSLKGNTYWYDGDRDGGFLLCFDFTRERFGPPLPLPSNSGFGVTVSLSSVREEQLVALFQRWAEFEIEIWVTNKIEPNAVSWRCFLKRTTIRLNDWLFGSFLIDEDKKVAVVFNEYDGSYYRTACIINRDSGQVKKVDLRESPYTRLLSLECSYLPSSEQI